MASLMNGDLKKNFEKILGKFVDQNVAEKVANDVEKWLNEEILPYLPFEIVKYKRDEHLAINTGITSKAEEKLKTIICPLIPRWMGPDVLTIIGFLGTIMVALGYLYGSTNKNYLVFVVLGLVVNWFGDSFDGSIARYWKKTRPNYGYYIDHIVDALAVLVMGLGFGYSVFVRIDVMMIFVAMYLIIEVHTLLVKTVENTFKYSFGPVGPTEARIIMIAFTLYIYFSTPRFFMIGKESFSQYDAGIMFLTLSTLVTLLVSIYQEGIKLHRQDIKKWGN
ncbi:MAG: CDP-alcohol phosphatidyltransferase family protein [Patescibacteria group bacterium]|jgi:phosphatidylglycerophosphate synthase